MDARAINASPGQPDAGVAAASAGGLGSRIGLGGRIVALVIICVMLTEVVVYLPSIANFRNNWLRDRLSAAYTAALVFGAAPADMVPADLASAILASVGARTIVIKMKDTRRLLAESDMPPEINDSFDLRAPSAMNSIAAAFRALLAPDGRVLQVVGEGPMGAEYIEITLDEAPLRAAMWAYSVNILLLSLMISAVVACLALFALHRMVLRPVRRLTSNIMAYGADPENAALIIVPSGRAHEIGAAETALAGMQRTLTGELSRSKRLAALGLAVAKINHDLRNILASAQLLSDRMAELSDPLGRSLAPRLVATLDRAISYCQSTLYYGKAAEPPPRLAVLALRALASEAAETALPGGAGRAQFVYDAPDDFAIRADADQMFRVLLNLLRNAGDALESAGPRPGMGAIVRLRARREATAAIIEIGDSGPGVPKTSRARMFEPFGGSARIGSVGLGLAIAADLVRAHGGELVLAEEPAEGLGGALFRISLPEPPAAEWQSPGP